MAVVQKPTLKSPNNRVRMIEAIIKPATIPSTHPQPLLNDWKKLVMAAGSGQGDRALAGRSWR